MQPEQRQASRERDVPRDREAPAERRHAPPERQDAAPERGDRPPGSGDASPAPPAIARPAARGVLTSFNWAFEGLVHALRREHNMQIHFAIAGLVLVAAMFFSLSRLEVVALLVAISFVLITEMINTAVENVVDMITQEDDPRAKVAKDVAAGAVLVAAVNALAVAYLVFYDKLTSLPYTVLSKVRASPIDVSVVALVLVILTAVALKAVTRRGTAFQGGLPSAHAAIAFSAWVAVTFVAANTGYALPISAIVLFLAVLVAQSRVQSGIHSLLEVSAGAALGVVVTLILFRLWYPL